MPNGSPINLFGFLIESYSSIDGRRAINWQLAIKKLFHPTQECNGKRFIAVKVLIELRLLLKLDCAEGQRRGKGHGNMHMHMLHIFIYTFNDSMAKHVFRMVQFKEPHQKYRRQATTTTTIVCVESFVSTLVFHFHSFFFVFMCFAHKQTQMGTRKRQLHNSRAASIAISTKTMIMFTVCTAPSIAIYWFVYWIELVMYATMHRFSWQFLFDFGAHATKWNKNEAKQLWRWRCKL